MCAYMYVCIYSIVTSLESKTHGVNVLQLNVTKHTYVCAHGFGEFHSTKVLN